MRTHAGCGRRVDRLRASEPPVVEPVRRVALLGDDLDASDRDLDVGVEPDRHLGGAELLERLVEA